MRRSTGYVLGISSHAIIIQSVDDVTNKYCQMQTHGAETRAILMVNFIVVGNKVAYIVDKCTKLQFIHALTAKCID